MLGRLHVTLIALSAAIVAILLLLIIKRYCLPQKTRTRLDAETGRNNDSLQNGIARLHQVSPAHNNNKDSAADSNNNNNYTLFKKAVSKRQGFSWAEHPALVTEAVENGWSRFAFTTFVSSPSSVNKSRNPILSSPCVTGGSDPGNESNPEITWEVCEGSSDYMQKIRFNPNLQNNKTGAGLSVIKAGLPLPGPYLGSSSFPQDAYFEIKIVSFSAYDRSDEMLAPEKLKLEGDKIKLIEEDFNKKTSPDSVIIAGSHSQRKKNKIIDDLKRGKLLQDEARVMLSVGLTCGGNSLPLKIPGSYQGSAGFNSSGSVYVNGTKLILESETNEWSEPDKVIGCGYNPSLKRVFFTVDSKLVHEIHCKTDEFTCPLYPVLASIIADTVVISVNLGQSPFKYLPANLQRTPNPCFVMMNNSPSLGFIEDSKELFSMERIDSQGMQRRSNNNTVNSVRSLEYDVESEGDLFEIVLDHSSSTVKSSPYITTSSYNQ